MENSSDSTSENKTGTRSSFGNGSRGASDSRSNQDSGKGFNEQRFNNGAQQGYDDRGSNGGGGYGGQREFSQKGDYRNDRPRAGAMEVYVENNIEKAMKVLKRKLIKEGLFKELKSRRYYEKPSERKKRKQKESVKKIRKEEARQRKNPFLFS